MRDQHDDAASRARRLLERGDGGYRPGEKFPVIFENSFHDKVLAATIGRTQKEHDEALRYEASRFTRASNIYPIELKGIRKGKEHIYKEDALRRSGEMEFSIDNKFIIPKEIGKSEFIDAYSAVAFLNARGIALNSHITICWELLGIKPKKIQHEKSHLHDIILHPLRNWYKQRGMEFFWLYTNEYSSRSGFHTHLLIHINSEHAKELKTYLLNKGKKINRLPQFNEKSIKTDIDVGMDLFKQWSLFQYICKGINRNHWIADASSNKKIYLEELIWAHYENPGNFHHIKRIAHSQNINKSNRDKFKFISLLEQSILDKNLLYCGGKPVQRLALEQKPECKSHNMKNHSYESSIFDCLFSVESDKTEDFKSNLRQNPFEINNLNNTSPKNSP